ncbi:flotillin domain-containing protein [Fadolivirus algeromassiliense]|jgi:flotillin|uniref:Flotillin domain-containing protein n=1 Tax=Fadolivirus FV1/VV64 TaxID=3070911 RepID=A0A7D3V8V6_9VIRU|nr:flotillin domain-containing protein [Fadolivirus algeromassiliense]QKF94097.1 flotillin domain-containing protein [Fadolivirus FV1/VV64]
MLARCALRPSLYYGAKPTSVIVNRHQIPPVQQRNFSLQSLADPTILGTIVVATGAIGGAVAFTMNRYRISKPDEYLVRTGLGIRDMTVSKQGYQWPFQTYQFIKMHPTNYGFDLQAMSSEKMEFVLPGVFTIGPKDDLEAIKKYVRFLRSDQNQTQIDTLVKGILEGETRIQSAQMTIEQIFNDRKAFKEVLIKNVQDELDQFGLQIYNANIKELQDSAGSEYFSFLRQKKRSEAENRAKVDVAEAKKTGDIGQKEREAVTRQQVAQFEAATVLQENERRQEIEKSNAELAVVKAAALQKTQLANIEAENAARIREAELQKEVEQRRVSMETEKLRATDLSAAQVHAETYMKEAEGKANALRVEAEARLFAKQKEADGILAVYNAQSSGIEKLIGSFGNNPSSLIQYLMLDKGVYETLARTNADAIKGLNPKITVWNTSSDGTGSDNYTKPIADILKMVPPLVSTIHDQTGIKPSDWLMNLPKENKE